MGLRSALGLFAAVSTAALIVAACANGTVAEDEDAGEEPIEEVDSSTPPRDAAKPPVADASKSDATVSDASTDATTDGSIVTDGGTTDGGTTDGGTSVSCASPNACLGAIMMTDVSGDKGADVSSATGSTSRWMKIRVSEDDSGVFAERMKIKVTLSSPPGTNFDMRIYLAGDGSSQKCTGPDQTTNATTGADVASLEWGESGTFSNGNDDDRTVTIEVFNVSGTCTSTQNWTLLVEGHKS